MPALRRINMTDDGSVRALQFGQISLHFSESSRSAAFILGLLTNQKGGAAGLRLGVDTQVKVSLQ